jgi:hypothetical protein
VAEPEKDQPQQNLTSEKDSETHQSQEPTKEDNVHPDLETPDDDTSFNPEYGRRKAARHPKRGHPRGITHIKFINKETAVATVDSAFQKPINPENHDLRIKPANIIRDRRPITVQPSQPSKKLYFSGAAGDGYVIRSVFQQFGDSIVNIHSLRIPQTDKLTSTGFIMLKKMQTAGEALVALNGTQTPGGDTLDLSCARRRRKQSHNDPGNHYKQDSSGFFDRNSQYLHTGTTLTETRAIHHQVGIGDIERRHKEGSWAQTTHPNCG